MVTGREGCCAGPLAGLFRRRAGGRERGLTAAGDAGSEAGARAAGQRAGLPLRPAAQGEAGQEGATLCHAMHLGADSTDDFDVLRSGRTGLVLGHRVLALSTLGTFLRSFTFGHVDQLDGVLGESLRRAWQAGAGVTAFVRRWLWSRSAASGCCG